MLTLGPGLRVYLATRPTDMRRSFDGLSAATREVIGADPLSGHLFVFFNAARTIIKVLFWDHGGFVVYYKRLEAGRFRWPLIAEGAREVELDATQLAMLLDGIDLKRVAVPRHWQPRRENWTASADP